MAKERPTDEREGMQRTILFLQEEIDRLKNPPFTIGTIINIGEKSIQVSVDKSGVYEFPYSNAEKKISLGERVILNPKTLGIIGASEFNNGGGEIGSVEEILGDRLKVQSKGESYLVLNAVRGVKTGDEVRLDASKAIAIEGFSKKKTKYSLEEIPISPWENIGGLESTITKIKQEVEEPFVHKDIFERYGKKPAKGILLYGPPGCGKTMIAKSIAYNLAQIKKKLHKPANGQFISINGPEILDKWLGNSEANIRRIYEAARDTASENKGPVIIFIDEAESVLKTRGKGISTDVYDSIVPQFLTEMDGLNGHSNIITILATNREDIIDPAVLRDGRVDRKIRVPRPNQEGAEEIFAIYLKGKPLKQGLLGKGKTDVRVIANKLTEKIYDNKNLVYAVVDPRQGVIGTFGYKNMISGAMIKGIVDRASNYAIQREIKDEEKGITLVDLETSISDEIREHMGFSQILVRSDWEDVFGSQGRRYQEAQSQGQLILEDLINKKYSIKSKEVKQ